MSASSPRLAGRSLRLVSRLLQSDSLGPSLRRLISGRIVDEKLDQLDFAAEGDPAPLYSPPPYRRPPVSPTISPTGQSHIK